MKTNPCEEDESDKERKETNNESKDLMCKEVIFDKRSICIFNGHEEGSNHRDLVINSNAEKGQEKDYGPKRCEWD